MILRPFFGLVSSAILFCSCGLAQQYTITTVAGVGLTPGFLDGSALGAQFSSPGAVVVGSNGSVYISDPGNQRIRLLSNGTVSTFAGNGTAGYSGDNAAATSAEIDNPAGIALDSAGNLYIADTSNNVVRKVDTSGKITTVAGNQSLTPGQPGNYTGDGGAAVSAQLSGPLAVALDSQGNIYIADSGDNVVRKVTVSTGNISTYVGGNLTQGRLNHPWGLAFDSANNLYIVDNGNHRVAKYVYNGTGTNPLTNFAGNGTSGFSGDGGQATLAMLNNPSGIALDSAGNVYIAENIVTGRIRRVAASTGIITSIAGSGRSGYSGDGGPATSAQFSSPRAVAVDNKTGNIYIADSGNSVIRMLQATSIAANNAASGQTQVSPGSLASIYGSGFATTTVQAPIPYPTTLGGVSVSVNGTAAPVFYVSPGQINFQIPWSTTAGTATVIVTSTSGGGGSVTVPVIAASPGIFLIGGTQAAALNPDYSVNSSGNPASEGTFVQVYATGLGPVSPPQSDGQPASTTTLANTNFPCTASLGTVPATALFCGMAPGWVGLWQVNVTLPTGMTPGTYPLTVTVNGQPSNTGNISVK